MQEGYNVALVHPRAGLLELHYRLWRDLDDNFSAAVFERAVPHPGSDNLRVLTPVDLVLMCAVHWMKQPAFVLGLVA